MAISHLWIEYRRSTDGMEADDSNSLPKSMRHRRILDIAAENPDAPIEEIASMVPSATPDLVERVLDEHGDPGIDGPPADTAPAETGTDRTDRDAAPTENTAADSDDPAVDSDEDSDGTDADGQDTPDEGSGDATAGESDTPDEGSNSTEEHPAPEDLTAKQREVLGAVAERPDATQREIGNQLDVSSATVSNRVNSIDGFDWREREAFVAAVFGADDTDGQEQAGGTDVTTDGGPSGEGLTSSEAAPTGDEPADAGLDDAIGRLDDRISDLETVADDLAELEAFDERVAEFEAALETATRSDEAVQLEPELLHKVVHACMRADSISEEEELRILRALLE